MKTKTKFKQTEIGVIPEDWEVVPLSQLAEVIDPHPSHRAPKIVADGFPFAGIGDINEDGSIQVEKCRKIGEEFVKQQENSYKINEDSIGYGRVGTVGKVVKLRKQEFRYALSPTLAVIQPINYSDSKFVYCVVRDKSFFSRVNQRMTGTTRPAIGIQLLRKILVPLPSKNERQIIAKIFSDLDSKIELNQQMNKTLEAIGRSIFKHWFVDFEFPNEEGKPYKSSGGEMVYNKELGKEIPEGWTVSKLGEIVEFAYGKGLPETKRQEGNYPVIGSNGIIGFHSDYLVSGPGVVIGRKGTLGEVYWVEENFFPIDTTFYLIDKLKSGALYFHYFMLKGKDFLKSSSDSAVPGLNRNAAYSNDIIVPAMNLIVEFNSVCYSIFKKKHNLQIQSQILSNIRDSLLPKLMSGKIRVPVEA